jgi:hypothetical protein
MKKKENPFKVYREIFFKSNKKFTKMHILDGLSVNDIG